jgi:hypothetical protein
MTSNKATNVETIATGEIDERDLDHVSGGVPAAMQVEEVSAAKPKLSLKQLETLSMVYIP